MLLSLERARCFALASDVSYSFLEMARISDCHFLEMKPGHFELFRVSLGV
jgi:hypothetical protein